MQRKILGAGLATLLTVICVALFLRNAPHLWDLQLWDETLYMATGIYTWNNHFQQFELSPLYSYLYRMAYVFEPDPMTLHLWMGVAVVGAAIVATTASVVVISRNVALGAVTAAIMIASGYSEALPKLVYAAVAIMSVGFAISTLLPRFHTKMACVALTAFVVTFIRPEFVIAYYASAAIAIVALVLSARDLAKSWIWPAVTVAMLVVIALLCKLWIFPVISGGLRALQAFGQHFSLYLFDTHRITADPFANYQKSLAEYLPGAVSESDALRKYPSMMIEFFLFNITTGLKLAWAAVTGLCMSHPLLVIAGVALMAFCVARRFEPRAAWGDLIAWLILAVPTATSIVLIFARDHYLVVASTLLILLAAVVVKRLNPRDSTIGAVALLILTALIVKPIPAVPQPMVAVAKELATQKPFGEMFDLDGGWCYYAPSVCNPIYSLSVPGDMMVYLDQNHVNAVMDSAALHRWAVQNNHTQFADFLDHGAPGWTRIPLSSEFTLIRRKTLDTAGMVNVLTSEVIEYARLTHRGKASGDLHVVNGSTLFVHPGVGDPTRVRLDVGKMVRDSMCPRVEITAKLDPGVTPDMIAAGHGSVIVVAESNGADIQQRGIVSLGRDLTFTADAASKPVTITVDDHGNPNYDWLNIAAQRVGCVN